MRKLFATIALCIILIGTFAPVSVSVSQKTQLTNTNQRNYQIALPIVTLQTAFAEENSDSSSLGFDCSWYQFACHLTIFAVDLLTFVPNAVAALFGILSDIFLKISISPGTYGAEGSGIESGIRVAWKIIRDFANIGFIFALFASAFSLIVGRDFMGDPKKTVVKVIIMALLINFSLLFCRIIIQTADVFSNLLYNRIAVQNGGGITDDTGGSSKLSQKMTELGYKPVSFKFLELSNPQQLFTNSGITSGESGSNTSYLIVGVLIFFVLLILIFLFIQMGMLFLGRIVGLWMGMIVSPIAFVSYAIPLIENNPYFGFKNWITSFAKLAFLTPLYLFFVYLAVTILGLGNIAKDLVGSIGQDGGYLVNVFRILLQTLVPLLMSLFILMQGKKIATDMAGVIGELVGKVSGAVSGLALGAATGGTAMLARQTVGRAGAAIGNSNFTSKMMESNTFLGKQAGYGLSKLGTGLGAASFDIRKDPRTMSMFGKATGAMGDKIDLGSNFMNTGGFATEGGIRDNLRGARTVIDQFRINQDKKIADELLLRDSSNASRLLRSHEEELARAKAIQESEKSRIDVGAENQKVTDVITALEEKFDITKVKTDATGKTAEDRLTEKKALEANTSKTAAEEARLKELKRDEDVSLLEKTEKEVKTMKDALNSEKDPEKQKLMTLRTIKQMQENKKLEAENSIEKEKMDKAKESMDKEKESLDKLDKEIKTLGESIKKMALTDPRRIDREKDFIKLKDKQSDQAHKYKKEKDRHTAEEKEYKKLYGNDIKNLDDAHKTAVSDFKKLGDNVTDLRNAQDLVIASQKKFNTTKNELDNINYERQLRFSENLQKQYDNRTTGLFSEYQGTIFGSERLGRVVRDSSMAANEGIMAGKGILTGSQTANRSADQIRRNLGKPSGK